jgi:hypothetical protein
MKVDADDSFPGPVAAGPGTAPCTGRGKGGGKGGGTPPAGRGRGVGGPQGSGPLALVTPPSGLALVTTPSGLTSTGKAKNAKALYSQCSAFLKANATDPMVALKDKLESEEVIDPIEMEVCCPRP